MSTEAIFKVISIILFVLFLTLLSIRLFFTMYIVKKQIPEIKASDNVISNKRIDEIGNDFKNFLLIDDYSIERLDTNAYISPYSNIDTKNKVIKVNTFNVPSAGYEIDNLLGSIWLAYKSIKKDKDLRYFKFFLLVLPIIGRILFYLGCLFQIILFFMAKENYIENIVNNKFIYLIYQKGVPGIIGIVGFIFSILSLILSNNSKNGLEINYETIVAKFIGTKVIDYKEDVRAARIYALDNKFVCLPSFYWIKKTSNLKYLGPLVNY